MDKSGFHPLNALPHNCAMGYHEEEDGSWRTNVYDLPVIGGGDGGLFSCIEDLSLLWKNLLSGQVIDKELLHMALSPHIKEEQFSYGFGVWLKKVRNAYIPYIVGEDSGVSFRSYYNPEDKVSIIVISNVTGGCHGIPHIIYDNLSVTTKNYF